MTPVITCTPLSGGQGGRHGSPNKNNGKKTTSCVFEELGSLSRWVVLCSLQEGYGVGGNLKGAASSGASGCFSAAPSFSAVPNVVWGGLCNRVSLQSQRVPLMHRDGRDLHGGSMRKHRAHLCASGVFLDTIPSIWIFKPSESQKGRPQIIIGCVFIVYLHWIPKYICKYLCRPIFVLLYSLKRGSIYIDVKYY